jgi:hypothetical protein
MAKPTKLPDTTNKKFSDLVIERLMYDLSIANKIIQK